MTNNKECYVCGGIDTEDGGLENTGRWFCSSGCWCDYFFGIALKNHIDKGIKEKFLKNLEDITGGTK